MSRRNNYTFHNTGAEKCTPKRILCFHKKNRHIWIVDHWRTCQWKWHVSKHLISFLFGYQTVYVPFMLHVSINKHIVRLIVQYSVIQKLWGCIISAFLWPWIRHTKTGSDRGFTANFQIKIDYYTARISGYRNKYQ